MSVRTAWASASSFSRRVILEGQALLFQLLPGLVAPAPRPRHALALLAHVFRPGALFQQPQLRLDFAHLGALLGQPALQVGNLQNGDRRSRREPGAFLGVNDLQEAGDLGPQLDPVDWPDAEAAA